MHSLRIDIYQYLCFDKIVTARSEGLNAEVLAKEYLQKKGYKFVTSNYHSRFGEIDIIMIDKNQLVFIEVKARKNSDFGSPAEFITYHKLSKILKTMQFFLTQNPKYSDYRVDAVEVFLEDTIQINHIENITL